MPANCLYSVTVALLTSSSAGRGDGASGRGDGARGRGARAAGHDHLLRLRRVDRVAIRADAVGLDVVVVGSARVARAQELARGHGDADAGRDAAARDREGAGAGDHQSEEHGGAHRGEFGPAQVVLPVVGRRCSVIRTDRAPPRRWSRAAADEEALRYESSSRNSRFLGSRLPDASGRGAPRGDFLFRSLRRVATSCRRGRGPRLSWMVAFPSSESPGHLPRHGLYGRIKNTVRTLPPAGDASESTSAEQHSRARTCEVN